MAAAQLHRLETGARAAVRISIDGYTPDGIPVIGPGATTPAMIHAIGFSGHGFQLGPAVVNCWQRRWSIEGRRFLSTPSQSNASMALGRRPEDFGRPLYACACPNRRAR